MKSILVWVVAGCPRSLAFGVLGDYEPYGAKRRLPHRRCLRRGGVCPILKVHGLHGHHHD